MSRIARFSRWTLALMIALVALGMTFGSAAAAPAGGAAAPPNRTYPALTKQYKVEQQRLKLQDARLLRAVEYTTKIDTLIAKLKAKGQDTTVLEQAVAAFRTGIASARTEWQAASTTLATHTGFDAAGKVTSADAARATLKDAHRHMEQVHMVGLAAYQQLHAAIVTYRKAHHGAQEPVAPSQP